MIQTTLPDWLLEDNELRQDSYARDITGEEFQYSLNELLAPHEDGLDDPGEESFPMIFYWGVPRCGKTVFSQLLVSALDLGYPDHIVARFWEAPYFGINLSNIVLPKKKQVNFQSDYGKTHALSDPHDFAYFWRKWFNMGDLSEYDHIAQKAKIDWKGLGAQLRKMSATWGKPAVFKGVLPSYFVSEIEKIYSKSIFVYVERDFIDSAVSLMKGRIDNYGNPDHWFGQTPAYEHTQLIKGLSGAEQIAGQFKYLTQMYEHNLGLIDQSKVIRTTYREFCEDPIKPIEMVKSRCHDLWNQQIEIQRNPQKSDFKYSEHAKDVPYYQELSDALEKFDLPLRSNQMNS